MVLLYTILVLIPHLPSCNFCDINNNLYKC
nr:MAG TPA: FAM24 family [Caudoviricetes sp.]